MSFWWIGAASVFSGLNLLLRLIFGSMLNPANLHFCTTLQRFMWFLRFRPDRIENDLEAIVELLEAPKIIPKSTKSDLESLDKNSIEKTNDFKVIFHR